MPDPLTTHQELIETVGRLESKLADYSTEAIAGSLAVVWLSDANRVHDKYGLTSPFRQILYLQAIALNTPEPSESQEIDDVALQSCFDDVSLIFDYYTHSFFPTNEERKALPKEWFEETATSMPLFLDYFNTGRVMGSTVQIIEKLRLYFPPQDRCLKDMLGISATEIVAVVEWISSRLQSRIEETQETLLELEGHRGEFLNIMETQGVAEAQDFMKTPACVETATRFYNLTLRPHSLLLSELVDAFGEALANAFWSLFTISRGRKPRAVYPTETLDVATAPLLLLEEGVASCPNFHALPLAAIERLDSTLRGSDSRDSYFKARDRILEEEGERLLKAILPPEAICLAGAFETADCQYEHDRIFVSGDVLLALEAKASAMREPLRDPQKAFQRAKDDFRSNKGIQKGFDQGMRILHKLEAGETVRLFDSKGHEVASLDPKIIQRRFVICLTAEDFGWLATDLGLLVKEESDPYPWAVNTVDLDSFIDALHFRGWGFSEFVSYLEQRRELYGKLKTEDELTVAGWFVEKGSLEALIQTDSTVFLHINQADVFDRIYWARQNGEPVTFDSSVQITSMNEIMTEVIQQDMAERVTWAPKRRCFCGSGKMYKNCCHRTGILPPKRKLRDHI